MSRFPVISRFARLLPVCLLLGGCLNDRAIAPAGNQASLDLGVQVSGVAATAGTFVRVTVEYQIPSNESSVLLLVARIPVTQGVNPVPLLVDLIPCLRDPGHIGGKACQVNIRAELVTPLGVVDQQFAGTYLLEPGKTVRAKTLKLVAGVNPPALQVDTAVRVDPSLVVYVVNASDPDGNLQYLDAVYSDSGGAHVEFVQHEFIPPVGGYSGAIFVFLQETVPNFGPQLSVTAYDSKFSSASQTLNVVPPDVASPTVSNVATTVVAGGQVNVSFDISDPQQDEARVLVLFRDPAVQASDPNSDALMRNCVANILPQDGRQTVGCTAPSKSAIVIVIPVDAAQHVGTAARGTVTIP